MVKELPTKSNRLAEWIAAKLEEREWNAYQLADRSGVSQPYLWGIMKRHRIPADAMAARIAKALGVPPDDVLALVYADRIETLVREAPRGVQKRFRKLLRTLA